MEPRPSVSRCLSNSWKLFWEVHVSWCPTRKLPKRHDRKTASCAFFQERPVMRCICCSFRQKQNLGLATQKYMHIDLDSTKARPCNRSAMQDKHWWSHVAGWYCEMFSIVGSSLLQMYEWLQDELTASHHTGEVKLSEHREMLETVM